MAASAALWRAGPIHKKSIRQDKNSRAKSLFYVSGFPRFIWFRTPSLPTAAKKIFFMEINSWRGFVEK
jgi:hypothetical protein